MSDEGLVYSSAAGTGRKLEDLSANELRARLECAGVKYGDTATKAELVELVRKI